MGTYYKELQEIINRSDLSKANMKINLKMEVLDFENFSYSQTEVNPSKPTDGESHYIFPTHTCFDNELIILSETN